MSGSYFYPAALSLLENNAFEELMMEATWAIVRSCASSILIAILCHTGVPLGAEFGLPSRWLGMNHFILIFSTLGSTWSDIQFFLIKRQTLELLQAA
jgi:hypothetical protein